MRESQLLPPLAARLRSKRREAGISAAELGRRAAQVLGRDRAISESAVRNQENGTNGVPMVVLQAYADVLNVPFGWLATGIAAEEVKEGVPRDLFPSLEELAVHPGTPISDDWLPITVQSDPIFLDNVLFIHIPGYEDEHIDAHRVADHSLEPVYSLGTYLLSVKYNISGVVDGDYVLVLSGSKGPKEESSAAVRVVRKNGKRIDLHSIGGRQPRRETLVGSDGIATEEVYIDRVFLGAFVIHQKSPRPLLNIPKEGLSGILFDDEEQPSSE